MVARHEALGQLVDDEQIAQEKSVVEEAAARFGLLAVQEDEGVETLYLWPENVPSWNLYQAVQTQWVVSEGQPMGLAYPGVEVVMRMRGIRRKDFPRMFEHVQIMERAALAAWHEKARRK